MIRNVDNPIINEFISETTKTSKITNTKQKQISNPEFTLTYHDYVKKNTSLKCYKVLHLKQIARQHKLHITGTKPVLIERIMEHFKKTKHAIKLQSYIRGWLVRHSFTLRGPAFKNRKLCVNDNDFVTLEPIDEIPMENFYSYVDSTNFTYGFDIVSIMQSIKQKNKFQNPYNREKLTPAFTEKIRKLFRISCIIFPEFKTQNAVAYTQSQPQPRNTTTQPRNNNVSTNTDQQNRITQMNVNRITNTLSQRIRDLFVEIDQLGNYTQALWFTSLSATNYLRLYRHLYDIWYYRIQLPRETRYNICPLNTPFSTDRSGLLDLDNIQSICLDVFENLVFTGIDDEHRRLGTLHSLTALTMVSIEARQALPWLYDSML
jgi:hypothetical protein